MTAGRPSRSRKSHQRGASSGSAARMPAASSYLGRSSQAPVDIAGIKLASQRRLADRYLNCSGGEEGEPRLHGQTTRLSSPSALGAIASAAIHALSDDFPNDRQNFSCCFLSRQGRICDIAHKLRDVVIDVLLGPKFAAGDGDINRIGVVHGTGVFADDVKDSSQAVGVCFFEKQLTDSVAGPHPSAGDEDVAVARRHVGLCKQSTHHLQIGARCKSSMMALALRPSEITIWPLGRLPPSAYCG